MESLDSADQLPLLELPDSVLLRIFAHLCCQPPSPSIRLHLPIKQQPAFVLSQCCRHLRTLFHQHNLQVLDARRSSQPVFELGTYVTQNMIPRSTTFSALRHPERLKRLIQIAGPNLRKLHLPDFRETTTGVDELLRCVDKYAPQLETLTFINDDIKMGGDTEDDRSRQSYLPKLIPRVKDFTVYDPDKITMAILATRPQSGMRRLVMHDMQIDTGEVFVHLLVQDILLPPPRLHTLEVSFATPTSDLSLHVTYLAQAIQCHVDLRDVTVLERTNVLVSHPSNSFPTKAELKTIFETLIETVRQVKTGAGLPEPTDSSSGSKISDGTGLDHGGPFDRLALFSAHFQTRNKDISLIDMVQLFKGRIGPNTLLELDFQEARLISPPKSCPSPEPYFSVLRISSHSGFLYELPDSYFRNVGEICIGMNTMFKTGVTGRSQIYAPSYDNVRSVCARAGHNVTIFRAGMGHGFSANTLIPLRESLETLSDVVACCPNIKLLEMSQNLIIAEEDDWVLLDLLFDSVRNMETLNLIDPRPFLEDLAIEKVFEHLPNLLDAIKSRCPFLQVVLMSRPIGHGVVGRPTKEALEEVHVALRRFSNARPDVDTSEVMHVLTYFEELVGK